MSQISEDSCFRCALNAACVSKGLLLFGLVSVVALEVAWVVASKPKLEIRLSIINTDKIFELNIFKAKSMGLMS